MGELVLSRLRRWARALRHGPDRGLHGRRRRHAEARLGERPAVVLFVCYGNICRSPYAEASLRRRIGGTEVDVRSAGFVGPGREVPDRGQQVAKRRGLDLSRHRSQQLTPELVESADLIVVMTAEQRRWLRQRYGRRGALLLGDLDPGRIDTRAIIDPVDQSEAVFTAVYERIDRCVAELARLVTAAGPLESGSVDGVVDVSESRV